MTDDELRQLGDDLILNTTFVLREASQPCTPETIMKYLVMALYPNASWDELLARGVEIYDRAKELLA